MFDQFSVRRLWGLVIKEFTQFSRDHSTFAIIIILPIIQLSLFGFVINTNPKFLPAALINFDQGPFSRTLIHGLENTHYFKFDHYPKTDNEASDLIASHQVLFSLNIPPDFSRRFVRGEHPSALLEVDGTDPVSVAYALSAANGVMSNLFQFDLHGTLDSLKPRTPPANIIVHTKYNPSGITQYSVVPGLLGVVLTMTFVIMAALSLTREREAGTMEGLLATPIRPLEVIIGKSIPFLIIGYLQTAIVIFLAVTFFKVPLLGSLWLLLFLTLPFILASLFVGILISTVATTQLSAVQMGQFFFLPSMLMSGFAFPFKGMPVWAQWISNALPLTHYVNIVRGIMLKGVGIKELWVDVWPICLFLICVLYLALKRYRQTLD